MNDSHSPSDLPTAVEMLETVLLLITGAGVGVMVVPGFTLTVAGLILFSVVVLAPLVAVAALVTLAGAIVAIPYLLARSIRGIRSRRAIPASEPDSVRGHRDASAAADTARPRAVAACPPPG